MPKDNIVRKESFVFLYDFSLHMIGKPYCLYIVAGDGGRVTDEGKIMA